MRAIRRQHASRPELAAVDAVGQVAAEQQVDPGPRVGRVEAAIRAELAREGNGAHALEDAQEALEVDVLARAGHRHGLSGSLLAVGGASGVLHLLCLSARLFPPVRTSSVRPAAPSSAGGER